MSERKKQNLIISIITIAGILLLIIAGFFYKQESRTYKYHNEKYGFFIKYPTTWSFAESKGGHAVIFYSALDNELDVFKESVNIVVQDLSSNPVKLNEYSKIAVRQMEVVFKENMIIRESGPTILAKQVGYKFVFFGKGDKNDLQYMSVWTIVDETAYQVTYTALASQYDRYLPKVKRMIRSFRIL